MSKRDPFNSNDNSVNTPTGTQVYRIISVKDDPSQSGRVLAVPEGDMEQYDDKKQYQWIPVSTPYFPQNKGIGVSPPHQYEPGSLVFVQDTGQQGKIVVSAVPNSSNTEGQSDTHPESRGKEYKHHNPDGSATSNPGQNYEVGSTFVDIEDKAMEPGFSLNSVRQFREQPHKHHEGKFDENRSKQETSKNYSTRRKTRNGSVENPIGMHQYKGKLDNATNFMQDVKSPPILSSAFSILSSLQSTAKSGSNVLATKSVGGQQNITAALTSASNHFSQIQKENEQNEKDSLEQYLRQLYEEITGKSPLDDKGKETKEYSLWKQIYNITMNKYTNDEFLNSCRDYASRNKFDIAFLNKWKTGVFI